jgi:RimJ/RimL family protein N-acetyltransferase
MNLTKAYRIETGRLIIRCYQPSDAYALNKALVESIDHLSPWLPWAKNEQDNVEEKVTRLRRFRGQFDLGEDSVYGIFDLNEEELIGGIGLHARVGDNAREIGYWISALHINKGYALEAVNAMTRVGFEIEQLKRIEIHCDKENLRSRRIPKKLGFTMEALLRERIKDSEGRLKDKEVWSIFYEVYLHSQLQKMPVKAFDCAGREIYFCKSNDDNYL